MDVNDRMRFSVRLQAEESVGVDVDRFQNPLEESSFTRLILIVKLD